MDHYAAWNGEGIEQIVLKKREQKALDKGLCDVKIKKSRLEQEKENFALVTQKSVDRAEKHANEWGASLDSITFVKKKSRIEMEKEAFREAEKMVKMCKK
jgi:SMC interacting uncharacterized protein involved in chromosome segregation